MFPWFYMHMKNFAKNQLRMVFINAGGCGFSDVASQTDIVRCTDEDSDTSIGWMACSNSYSQKSIHIGCDLSISGL